MSNRTNDTGIIFIDSGDSRPITARFISFGYVMLQGVPRFLSYKVYDVKYMY